MNRKAAILRLLPFLVYLAFALPLLDAPLRWDETEWPPQAIGVLRHGVPVVHFDESRFQYHPEAWLQQWGADYGLWHPPLYLHALAGWMRIAGDSTPGIRLFGLICGLVSLYLMTRIIDRMVPDNPALATIAALATSLNPFWVHGTLLADIDSTLLCPLLIAYIDQVLRFVAKRTAPRGVVLALLLVLLLWTKLTTPVLVVFAVATFLLVRSEIRAAVLYGTTVLTGASLFAASWMSYAKLTGAPAQFFLEFTYFGRTHELFRFRLWETVNALRFNVTQLSFPFVAIVLGSAALRLGRLRRTRGSEPGDLLWICGFAILLFYTCVFTLFGKYTVVLVPLFSAAAVLSPGIIPSKIPAADVARWLWVFLGCALYGSLTVPDIIVGPSIARSEHVQNFSSALHDPRIRRYILAGFPLLALALAIAFRESRSRRLGRTEPRVEGTFLFLCSALLAAGNIVENCALYGAAHSSHILTPSDELGFSDTVAWLKDHAEKGDLVLSSKEFAYYLPDVKVIPLDREMAYSMSFLPELFREHQHSPKYIVHFPRADILSSLPADVRPSYQPVFHTDDYVVEKKS